MDTLGCSQFCRAVQEFAPRAEYDRVPLTRRQLITTTTAASVAATISASAGALAPTAATTRPVKWSKTTGTAQGNVYAVQAKQPPSRSRRRPPICIYHHGAGGRAETIKGEEKSAGQKAIIEALASAGYLVMVSDFGGDLFGNELNHHYIDEIVRMGRRQGGRHGKVAIVGASMGGGAALSYAGNYPAKVACVVGLIPAINFEGLHRALPTLLDPPFDGEYDNQTHGPRHSPLVMAKQRHVAYPDLAEAGMFSAMPIAIWFATKDAVCLPNANYRFARRVRARLNPQVTLHPIEGTHSETTISAVPVNALVRFVRTHHPI